MVDDHYDINLYNDKFINWVKYLLVLLTLYWINIDYDYCTAMVIITIICYLIKQVDKIYYKFVAILILMNFVIQFDIKKFTLTKIYELIAILIIACICGYSESKLYPEEVSYKKFYTRLLGCISTIIYLYLYKYHYYLYAYFKNNEYLGWLFTLIEPDVEPILAVLGYGLISVFNLHNKLRDNEYMF